MSAGLKENIVLIGFMGTGKTTVGKMVARKLGFQFIDTDHVVVEREGMPIAQIFAERGEAPFRLIETSALESLEHLQRCVISTGGGVVTQPRNWPILRRLGLVVRLTASEDVIFERVSRNDKRPLLQTDDPRGTMHQLLAAREEMYASAAQITVDTTTLPLPEAAAAIVQEARHAFSWQRTA